jgi:predicted amidohydrolase
MTANRIGTESRAGATLTFTGGSLVCDPGGRVVARAATDAEETLAAELDLDVARDKRITGRNHRFDDRRPDLYRSEPRR